MEPKEFITIGNTARLFFGKFCGLCFDGFAIFFEGGDFFWGVLDLEDLVDFTDCRVFSEPA